MVRYLFYTIGDLTYQSPLVVCEVQSTVHDTVPQFQVLCTFRQQILTCLPPIRLVVVVRKLKTVCTLYEGSIFLYFDKNNLSKIVFLFSGSPTINYITILNNRLQCPSYPVGLYLRRAVV